MTAQSGERRRGKSRVEASPHPFWAMDVFTFVARTYFRISRSIQYPKPGAIAAKAERVPRSIFR
jgi:hypothetical protein